MTKPGRTYPFGVSRRTWPWFAAGVVVVLALLVLVDHAGSTLATAQSQATVDFFNQLTRWGQSDWILYPSAALLLVSAILARLLKDRIAKLALIEMVQMYGLIFVGVGLPGLATNLLKRAIGRARPEMFDAAGTLGFQPILNGYAYESFPSGHTTTAFAAAMVLGFLAPRWFVVGLVYAVGIAVSRLVVGAHYPSDVLGGAVVGTLGAYAVRNFFASRRWGFEFMPDGRIRQRPVVAVWRLAGRFQRRPAR